MSPEVSLDPYTPIPPHPILYTYHTHTYTHTPILQTYLYTHPIHIYTLLPHLSLYHMHIYTPTFTHITIYYTHTPTHTHIHTYTLIHTHTAVTSVFFAVCNQWFSAQDFVAIVRMSEVCPTPVTSLCVAQGSESGKCEVMFKDFEAAAAPSLASGSGWLENRFSVLSLLRPEWRISAQAPECPPWHLCISQTAQNVYRPSMIFSLPQQFLPGVHKAQI